MKHVLRCQFIGLLAASSLLTGCFSGGTPSPSVETQPQTQTPDSRNQGRPLPPPVGYPPIFYPQPLTPVVFYPTVFFPPMVFFPLDPPVYFPPLSRLPDSDTSSDSRPSSDHNEHPVDERTILAEIEKGLNFALTNYYRTLFPKNRTGFYGVAGGYDGYQLWYFQTGIARRIHGTAHATRAVLWSQLFAALRESVGQRMTENTRIGAGLVAAFHDSGRQDDGVDFWDSVSASQLKAYLDTTPSHRGLNSNTLSLAIQYKDDAQRAGYSLEQALLNASDTVEIMRTSKARLQQGFQEDALYLPSQISSDLKLSLLLEIQDFIDLTEDQGFKMHLENSATPYRDLLYTVDQNQRRFPTLYRFLAGQIAAL